MRTRALKNDRARRRTASRGAARISVYPRGRVTVLGVGNEDVAGRIRRESTNRAEIFAAESARQRWIGDRVCVLAHDGASPDIEVIVRIHSKRVESGNI